MVRLVFLRIICHLLFLLGDRAAQLLNAAFILSGGFVARPIGALLFGICVDRHGLRAALVLSVTMMCVGSLLIAATPTGLGFVSPLLLVSARLAHRLAVGGEYGASVTYVSEMASAGHRGFWSGVLYVTLIGGQLAAIALQVALQHVLGEEALYAWGWRVPFVIGAALAVVVLWIRRGIEETRSFSDVEAPLHERGRPLELLVEYPRQTAIVFGLAAAGAIGFYTYAVYMQKLLVNPVGFDRVVVSVLMSKVLATLLLFPPLLAGGKSIRVTVHFQDVDVMREPVE